MDKKTLSQLEVDNLLSDLWAEESHVQRELPLKARKRVKSYEFKHPDKFAKDQIRTLQMLHENFARLLSSSLSAYLRMNAKVNLASVEQSTFEKYIHQLTNPGSLGIISTEPFTGNIIVDIDSRLAFAIVDRLLGGRGKTLETTRVVTDIERVLIDRVLRYACDALAESWKNVAEITLILEETVVRTQFTRIASLTEVVVTISFEVEMSDSSGRLGICIPYSVLEPILRNLDAEYWLSESRRAVTHDHQPNLIESLGKAKVCVTAELGSTDVSVQELLETQVGDVIRLDSWPGQDVKVWVEGHCKYCGQPGLVRDKIGIQITSVIKEEGDQID